VIYTAPMPELCADHGPLLAGGGAVFFLPPDATVADEWLAPLPAAPHARQIEALGATARAVVLRAEDASFAAALRAALPSLPPFAAVQGRLVAELPPLPRAEPAPARREGDARAPATAAPGDGATPRESSR
jgi:hypothetical protein